MEWRAADAKGAAYVVRAPGVAVKDSCREADCGPSGRSGEVGRADGQQTVKQGQATESGRCLSPGTAMNISSGPVPGSRSTCNPRSQIGQ